MLNRGSLPIATQKQKKVVSQPNPYEDRLLRMCSFIWLHVSNCSLHISENQCHAQLCPRGSYELITRGSAGAQERLLKDLKFIIYKHKRLGYLRNLGSLSRNQT